MTSTNSNSENTKTLNLNKNQTALSRDYQLLPLKMKYRKGRVQCFQGLEIGEKPYKLIRRRKKWNRYLCRMKQRGMLIYWRIRYTKWCSSIRIGTRCCGSRKLIRRNRVRWKRLIGMWSRTIKTFWRGSSPMCTNKHTRRKHNKPSNSQPSKCPGKPNQQNICLPALTHKKEVRQLIHAPAA